MRLSRPVRTGIARHLALTGVAAVSVALIGVAPAAAARPSSATGKACTVLGTVGNDHLKGTHGYDVICGFGGDDVLEGGGGADVLDGGAGNDVIDGGDGRDTAIGGSGDDTVRGGRGDDYAAGGDGTDILDGGGGSDALDGGPGNDALDGGAAAEEPNPALGNDRLTGGDGNDTLTGGPGNDTVRGGTGNDRASGGDGNDTVGGDDGDDTVTGGNGNDRLDAGRAVTGDELDGGAGNDALNGGAGNDALEGGAGRDTLRGGNGNDRGNGGDGNDALDGGDDDDRLEGGRGDDSMEGGTGINACIRDQEDSSPVDKCTDRHVPAIDISSLRWMIDPAVDNRTDNTIRVRVRATDDRSGLYYVWMKLRSPDPTVDPLWIGFHYRNLVAGKTTNGMFDMEARLPAMSPVGSWTVQEVYAQDRVNRYMRYTVAPDGSYAASEGGETGTVRLAPLVVTGVADAEGPVVDLAATRWNTGTALDNSVDRPITRQIPVTDDLSGATAVSATLDVAGVDAPTIKLTAARLVSGTRLAGVWELSGTVPAYTPAGDWTVSSIAATDAARHVRTIRPDGGAWPPALTVTGLSDMSAPTADMTFAEYVGPTTADNSVDRTVTMRVRVADDLSGVGSLFLDYRTDGAQSRLDPIGPPDADGTWTLRGTLSATTMPGEWRITGIYLTDKVGRERVYYIQKDGSYTTRDHSFSGVAHFPSFTLTAARGG
jgi:hypothetical protein